MCFAKPRLSKWDFPDSTLPNSISDWEIQYFRNSHACRTPDNVVFGSHADLPPILNLGETGVKWTADQLNQWQ